MQIFDEGEWKRGWAFIANAIRLCQEGGRAQSVAALFFV
jgi:hypothetical protein